MVAAAEGAQLRGRLVHGGQRLQELAGRVLVADLLQQRAHRQRVARVEGEAYRDALLRVCQQTVLQVQQRDPAASLHLPGLVCSVTTLSMQRTHLDQALNLEVVVQAHVVLVLAIDRHRTHAATYSLGSV